jgi:biopolymer transport protein ExbB/biopolymer transport protein TolQ
MPLQYVFARGGKFSKAVNRKRIHPEKESIPRRNDSVILAQLAHFASHPASLAMFQEQSADFSLIGLWTNMGLFAKGIAIVLFIMSIWSLAVMIDRYLYFTAARKQSREFAPKVAGALKDSKLEEAIKIADRSKKSHLAEVVTAGLQEFRSSQGVVNEETIESSKRALERAEAIVHAKLKRGLGVLATIGATAPFVGLLGTVMGILNAFQQIAVQKSSGIGAVAGGISEALVTTAFGLLVAIPAVMTFNYFSGRVEAFDVEMDNSSSELVDYFIKQSHKR